ncbi:MAG: hypothetical protein LBF27_14640 [Sphingobacterium sp.]|jgi:hypothetical protein|nr:hypothetical protein [Sphingobacterium sp.]
MKLLKFLVALVICCIAAVSCKKNETPDGGGSSAATGSFIGRVQFQGNSLSVDRENRLIRILRENSAYKIEFLTGVPNITGVNLIQDNDSTWTSNDATGLKSVKIEGKLLTIRYQSDGQSWVVIEAIRK